MREGWTEHDSKTFLRDADCFVPERELLFESVCRLVPNGIQSDLVVELCCGDGSLSEVILDQIEGVRVLAMDGSEAMLQACYRRTERFGDPIKIRRFDLASWDWRRFAESPRAIVSTFAIHRLPDSAKQDLYRDLAAPLAPGGVPAIADLIRPASTVSTGPAVWQWDKEVKERSIRTRGDLSAFSTFQAEQWNHHATDDPDPIPADPSDRSAPMVFGGGS